MDYLYHYTSLESLALILRNKSIRFNNLLNVDDIEEAETQDMGTFGKFVYLSCWTEDSEESIPLWNMYTRDMHGVRIRMPIFPFRKYYLNRGDFYFSQDVETYINVEKLYNENKIRIVPDEPLLVKVEYTNDNNKLFPTVRTESFAGAKDVYLSAKRMEDIKEKSLEESLHDGIVIWNMRS